MLETYFESYPSESLALAPDFDFEFVPMFLEYGPRRLEVVMGGAASFRVP